MFHSNKVYYLNAYNTLKEEKFLYLKQYLKDVR